MTTNVRPGSLSHEGSSGDAFDMGLVQRGARNRRTPYYEATQRYGPKGMTV